MHKFHAKTVSYQPIKLFSVLSVVIVMETSFSAGNTQPVLSGGVSVTALTGIAATVSYLIGNWKSGKVGAVIRVLSVMT